MSGEIVNLRRARKARDRSEREKAAAENRRRFGRSKAEKQRDEAERRRRDAALDGRLRDPDGKR